MTAVDPFPDAPLLEEAPKAMRHILEEELRKLPLTERIDRIMSLIIDKHRDEPTISIRRRRIVDAKGAPYTVYQAYCDGFESGPKRDIDEAVVHLGASIIEKLDQQADSLRQALDSLDSKISLVRGPR